MRKLEEVLKDSTAQWAIEGRAPRSGAQALGTEEGQEVRFGA